MKNMKKLTALVLLVAIAMTSALALAKTVAPEGTGYKKLAGTTIHATVGAYQPVTGLFEVTLYKEDIFETEDVEKLKAGDTLFAGGQKYTVSEKQADEYGGFLVKCEDGMEICFSRTDDKEEMSAAMVDDDRVFMHAFAVMYLAPAADITYEDASDPDLESETVVTSGLEEILKIKAEKEETSIGFDFYATEITLNEDMEIVKIHQGYDVAQ